MDFKVNNTSVKTVIYNGNVVKKVDVYSNGATTTVYKKKTDLLLNGTSTDISGGFNLRIYQYANSLTYNPTLGCLDYLCGQGGSSSDVFSVNAVNLDGFSTLNIECKCESGTSYSPLYFQTENGQLMEITADSCREKTTFSMPLSIFGNHRIVFGLRNLNPIWHIYNIWLE